MKRKCLLLLALFATSYLKADNYSYDNSCGCWWNGIWVEAEFLYWKPCLSDSRVGSISTLPPRIGQNNLEFLSFDWEPGVRATIGKNNLWCGLNLRGSYVYMKPEGQVDLAAPAGSLIFSDFLLANYGAAVADFSYSSSTALFQKHTFTYQTWEVLLSREFNTPCLDFIPFFGVEGLILDQRLDFSTANGANSVAIDTKLDYSGVGLKAGMDIVYPLCGCLDFFLKPSFSMVYGTKDWKVSGNGVTNDTTPLPVNFNANGSACVFIPGFDIQLGFKYMTCCWDKLMGVSVGWEFLQWSNIPQINRFNTTDDDLTLGFQGLTAGGFVVF
jgi:hypothetical protein